MSSNPYWKLPAKKRARVLGLVALVIASILGVTRHFADFFPAQPAMDGSSQTGTIAEKLRALGRSFESWEWSLYDETHLYGKKSPIDPDIVILGIDDASLDIENTALPEEIEQSRALQLMKGWPWSREVYAHVLDRLFEAGAKTVVMDLLFPGPSNVSEEGDIAFRAALDRHRGKVVIAADFVSAASGGQKNDSISLPWEGFIPQTWPADERVGFVTIPADADDIIRRAQFFQSETGEPERGLPSLAAAVLRLQGKAEIIPINAPNFLFRFSDPGAYAHLPLHDLFIPSLWESNLGNGSFFRGKTVFIGPVARQHQDVKRTAVGTLFGVQIHAHTLAALKQGSFLHYAPTKWRLGMLLFLILAAAGLVFIWPSPMGCMLTLIVGIFIGRVGQLLAFNHLSFVIPMVVPLSGWALTGFIGLTFDYLMERKKKQAFYRAITRYFSPDMSAEILKDPDDYYKALKGANRTITLIFSDVRGFTSMSESAEPADLVRQLNEYLDAMVRIVYRHRGSIDKFIGDAVMAVWGRLRAPSDEKTLVAEATAAVSAAVDMREELVVLNVDWQSRGMEPLAFGIGVHQGEAIVGDIGSSQRTEFTAIGDTVNSASRLESATKQYGVDLLISDVVRKRVADQFICRTADLVKVQGKTHSIETFTVIGRHGSAEPASLGLYEQAVRSYRSGLFKEALNQLSQCVASGLNDSLTRLYIERCKHLAAEPPKDWDGVWVMTKK